MIIYLWGECHRSADQHRSVTYRTYSGLDTTKHQEAASSSTASSWLCSSVCVWERVCVCVCEEHCFSNWKCVCVIRRRGRDEAAPPPPPPPDVQLCRKQVFLSGEPNLFYSDSFLLFYFSFRRSKLWMKLLSQCPVVVYSPCVQLSSGSTAAKFRLHTMLLPLPLSVSSVHFLCCGAPQRSKHSIACGRLLLEYSISMFIPVFSTLFSPLWISSTVAP